MTACDVEYTVAICNYEMAETLKQSLRSIIDQLDDRFEVLVVDDGSEDGSIEILNTLASTNEMFRYVIEDNDNLAEARNSSFHHASGNYILESLDVDDQYEPVIQDFCYLYHQIESAMNRDFYLWGRGINMAPRELLLEVPYRSLGYGEDKDLWRRLLARDQIIFIDHKPLRESIGYNRTWQERLNIWFESSVVEFQVGTTVQSFILCNLAQIFNNELIPWKEAIFNLLTLPMALFVASRNPQYEPVDEYRNFGTLKRQIRQQSQTIREIEKNTRVEIDESQLTELGYETFLIPTGGRGKN